VWWHAFIDKPDTFDPAAPTGTVLSLGFDPPQTSSSATRSSG
jgi:hypothetical protein